MQNSYFSCMNIHEYDMKMMCEIIYILSKNQQIIAKLNLWRINKCRSNQNYIFGDIMYLANV